jgi:hypothetical protein
MLAIEMALPSHISQRRFSPSTGKVGVKRPRAVKAKFSMKLCYPSYRDGLRALHGAGDQLRLACAQAGGRNSGSNWTGPASLVLGTAGPAVADAHRHPSIACTAQ